MTEIERIGWRAPPRVASPRAGPSSFSVPPKPASASGAAATAAPQPPSAVSILALQELGGEAPADREARRHGQDMLAALTELQRALLGGDSTDATLRRLGELVTAVPLAADPRLAAMISAIVLRVRVELARRENAGVSAC
jgi:hypothetical protein